VRAVDEFLKDIKAFRKPLTHQKYAHILQLCCEHVAPKSDVREMTGDDIKNFLAWRKSKGFDPGTTLYTDRVILHNFFNKLGIDNPVKDVPRLPRRSNLARARSIAALVSRRLIGRRSSRVSRVLENLHRIHLWTTPKTGASCGEIALVRNV
jgi:hypothetical protein